MCEPATIAYGVIAVATAVAGTMQAQEAQEQQAEAVQNQMDADAENNRRAMEAQALQQRANTEQASQQNYRVAQEIQQRQREALRERASIRASSAEAGIGGISANRSLLSISLAENEAVDQLNVQRGFTGNNLGLEQESAKLTGQNRIQTTKAPSNMGLGFGDYLQIGGQAVGAYQTASSIGSSFQTSNPTSNLASTDTSNLYSKRNQDFYKSGSEF